ncbi:MAG: ATP-binding protein [Lachnospira sp.]
MLLGRQNELTALKEAYESGESTLTVVYGRTGIGKTSLIREFIKDKTAFYYSASQSSEKEQLELIKTEFQRYGITGNESEDRVMAESEYALEEGDMYGEYAHLFKNINKLDCEVKLVIIEEFQNIVKYNKEFMTVISDMVKGKFFDEKVCVIVTSSSISWVENSMVSAIGHSALSISSFLKLKELSFVDIVRLYGRYSVLDSMVIYAITGGVPGYLKNFSDRISLKENIIKNILTPGSSMRSEGADYIKEELRETSLYNTILYCIANGENKLNELHAHTGFGRDKISVYLKNLIEREIVEKIYSYDIGGKEHTKKGLYRIKSGYTEFWFRYIYGNESQLEILDREEFYERYIAPTIYEFASETFVKVGTEFIELLDSVDRLEIKIARRGRWWGKNGDIDIIACDNEEKYLVGKCSWLTDTFTFKMFEELMLNVELAGIGADYIYLFSKDTFDEELKNFAADNDNIKLISLKEL